MWKNVVDGGGDRQKIMDKGERLDHENFSCDVRFTFIRERENLMWGIFILIQDTMRV